MGKYETVVRAGDAGSSQSVILDLVGPGKRTLDVGCASGYTARGLVDQGCTVVGIESDEQAAAEAAAVLERVVVADLEQVDLVAEFGAGVFDAIVYGDVLEHLADPVSALRQSRELLAPGGILVASIPNVAHGDVRLALLDGRWDYTEVGLLDRTHVHFYTLKGVLELMRGGGFAITDLRRIPKQLFDSEIPLQMTDYPVEVVQRVLDDPESQVYQYVVRAVPDDAEGWIAAMHTREEQLREELASLDTKVHDLAIELATTQRRLEASLSRASDLAAENALLRPSQEQLDRLRTMPAVRAASAARRAYRSLLQGPA
jgi:2-polyprenyl-3-methyl-5-hydroxy-6-metoxy-1,4-benzoquinol methylase